MQRKRSAPHIRIAPVDGSSDRCVAVFTSEALDATFAVIFCETVSGAVALHSFADMIRSRYGVAPELTVVDVLPHNAAVTDVVKSLNSVPAFPHRTL